jgi:plastocyanin
MDRDLQREIDAMMICGIRKPAFLALGLSATLAVVMVGCGGGGGNVDDGVVVPEPNVNLSSKSAASTPPTDTGPTKSAGSGSTAPVAPPIKAEGWGTLKGKVVFSGTPTEAKVLQEQGKAAKDPTICAKSAPILSERLVVDSATKGVKNVFVYVQRPTAVNEDARKVAATLKPAFDQKGCVFIPHALAVMVGQTVEVKSSDATSHNVNFGLKALQSNESLAPGGSKEIKPDSPERSPGLVSCSIHPWMTAYWMVLDHPYFAVTDEKGNFEIKNVPAGTQKVVVWQEAAGYVTPGSGEDVNIAGNGETTKDFTISKIKPES